MDTLHILIDINLQFETGNNQNQNFVSKVCQVTVGSSKPLRTSSIFVKRSGYYQTM